jgi:hypothetical protein
MTDSHLHPNDSSAKENDDGQTDTADTVDKGGNQAPTQKEFEEARREEERQLETGEENPT